MERGRSLTPSGGWERAGAGGGGQEGHLRRASVRLPSRCSWPSASRIAEPVPPDRAWRLPGSALGRGGGHPAGGLCRGRGLFLTPPVTPLASRRSC